MITLLTILVVAGMLATLGVMLAGMIGLSTSRTDPMRSNRLMRYRVILQGVTLLLFVLLMAARHG
jgi:hypothetical protein